MNTKGSLSFSVFILAIICLWSNPAQAGPFLGCQPYVAPDVIPDRFKVTLDNGAEVILAPWSGVSGGVTYTNIVHQDLVGIAVGNHVVKAKACKGDPLWGQEVCSTEGTLNFQKPSPPGAAPAPPGGLSILP